MFERYTEDARRALFFSRYEATQNGDGTIEAEHLLLGVLRIDRFGSLFGANGLEIVRAQVRRERAHEPTPTSVEIPFAVRARQALEAAATIADEAKHPWIGPEHLLAAIAALDGTRAATIIREAGLTRERILAESHQPDGPLPTATHGLGLELTKELGRMLVEQRCRALTDELFIATDQKDWTRARRLFADGPIDVDMSSLAGGGPVRISADDLIDGFRRGLHAGKTSHHLVGTYAVTAAPERHEATVLCHGYAWNRVAALPPGEDLWETWGTYELLFRLRGERWQIVSFTYVSKLTRGNDAVRTHVAGQV